jgi:hypothetical protein
VAAEYVIQRVVPIAVNLTVELRVSHATAVAWGVHLPQQTPLLYAFAAARALREAYEELEARGILEGRWRFSWTGGAVVVESAT